MLPPIFPRHRHDYRRSPRFRNARRAGNRDAAGFPPGGLRLRFRKNRQAARPRAVIAATCDLHKTQRTFLADWTTHGRLLQSRSPSTTPGREGTGAVAQLVRAPDCRSGGYGFEPRRPRLIRLDIAETPSEQRFHWEFFVDAVRAAKCAGLLAMDVAIPRRREAEAPLSLANTCCRRRIFVDSGARTSPADLRGGAFASAGIC